MTRDVKRQKRGDGYVTETILIKSGNKTDPQSVDAYKDLITTMQLCIDSGLLRATFNCPDKISFCHTPEGWIIETLTVEENDG